jgi:hypothetical protein
MDVWRHGTAFNGERNDWKQKGGPNRLFYFSLTHMYSVVRARCLSSIWNYPHPPFTLSLGDSLDNLPVKPSMRCQKQVVALCTCIEMHNTKSSGSLRQRQLDHMITHKDIRGNLLIARSMDLWKPYGGWYKLRAMLRSNQANVRLSNLVDVDQAIPEPHHRFTNANCVRLGRARGQSIFGIRKCCC